jgi:hypothetical protein
VLGDLAMFSRIMYKSNTALAGMRIFNMIIPLSARLMLLMFFFMFSYAGLLLLMSFDRCGTSWSHQYEKLNTKNNSNHKKKENDMSNSNDSNGNNDDIDE